jgi:hypothetical protein
MAWTSAAKLQDLPKHVYLRIMRNEFMRVGWARSSVYGMEETSSSGRMTESRGPSAKLPTIFMNSKTLPQTTIRTDRSFSFANLDDFHFAGGPDYAIATPFQGVVPLISGNNLVRPLHAY